MKLTSFTDYSLRVLMYLAAQPGRRATIAEIAEAFDVSQNHLTKVVHFLGKRGWLANVRGKGGGMNLAVPPDQIVIGDVVRQTEGSTEVVDYYSQERGHCAIARICRLRGALGEAVSAFHHVLDRYTLEDMVDNRQALTKVFIARSPMARNANQG